VTYDENGFYGHPDHIQAHRVTMAALERSGVEAKVYFPTVRRSAMPEFAKRLEQAGIEPPSFDPDRFGSEDEDIAATIDCRAFAKAKRDALAAHSSQRDNVFFLQLPVPVFVETFGNEEFVRSCDPFGSARPEDDLFAGVPLG
jgi:LmbE family N-acetylglucosaminyl deacetylase